MIHRLFNNTFVIQRYTTIDDGQGGIYKDWQNVAVVKGRLRPASASERIIASQSQAEITHVFYCHANEDIQRGDRIVKEDGLTVEVVAIREPSYASHHWEIDGKAVQYG